jgi:hypothetical protein
VVEAGATTWPRGQATLALVGEVLGHRRRGGEAGVEDHAGRLQGAGDPRAVERGHVVAVVGAGLAHVGDVLAEQEAGELQRDRGAALVGEHVLGAGELAEEGDAEDGAFAAVGELDGELAEEVAADDAADVGRGAGGAGRQPHGSSAPAGSRGTRARGTEEKRKRVRAAARAAASSVRRLAAERSSKQVRSAAAAVRFASARVVIAVALSMSTGRHADSGQVAGSSRQTSVQPPAAPGHSPGSQARRGTGDLSPEARAIGLPNAPSASIVSKVQALAAANASGRNTTSRWGAARGARWLAAVTP